MMEENKQFVIEPFCFFRTRGLWPCLFQGFLLPGTVPGGGAVLRSPSPASSLEPAVKTLQSESPWAPQRGWQEMNLLLHLQSRAVWLRAAKLQYPGLKIFKFYCWRTIKTLSLQLRPRAGNLSNRSTVVKVEHNWDYERNEWILKGICILSLL